jgi:Tfp pilus assembly protein PilE
MKRIITVILVASLGIGIAFVGHRSYHGYRYKLEWTTASKLLLDLYAYLHEYAASHDGQLPVSISRWQSGVFSNSSAFIVRLASEIDYRAPTSADSTNVVAHLRIYTGERVLITQDGTLLRIRE